ADRLLRHRTGGGAGSDRVVGWGCRRIALAAYMASVHTAMAAGDSADRPTRPVHTATAMAGNGADDPRDDARRNRRVVKAPPWPPNAASLQRSEERRVG